MTLNRRGFLGAVSALAGKRLAAKADAALAQVNVSGLISGGFAPCGPPSSTQAFPEPKPTDWARGLRNAFTRHQVTSMLYELEHHVYQLDPDLAVNRSMSLSAKLVFQRQRNVARRLADLQQEFTYNRMNRLLWDFLGRPFA